MKFLKLTFPIDITIDSNGDISASTTYFDGTNFLWPDKSSSLYYMDYYPIVLSRVKLWGWRIKVKNAPSWFTTIDAQWTTYSYSGSPPLNAYAYPHPFSNISCSMKYDWPSSEVYYTRSWRDLYLTDHTMNLFNVSGSGQGTIELEETDIYMFEDDDSNYDVWLADSRMQGYVSTLDNDWIIDTAGEIPTRKDFPRMIETEDLSDYWVADVLYYTREWSVISEWSSNRIDGEYVWNYDGDTYFLKRGVSTAYILNKITHLWERINFTWEGGTPSLQGGNRVWVDETNCYYSYQTNQYILNKAESKWYKKTWTGLTNFYGEGIWSDGTNIYYSMGDQQYVLDKANSTWDVKTWNGMTNFYGSRIWSDGTNIYYSKNDQSSGQRVLNKATSTWETVTWYKNTGSTFNPDGQSIWTDGTDVYYSNYSTQYVLNKSDMKWYPKTWTGLNSFNGSHIWNDGERVYYSYDTSYELKNKAVTSVPYRIPFPEMIESYDVKDVWLIDDDIPFMWLFPEMIQSVWPSQAPPSYFTFKDKSSAEFGKVQILPLCLKHEEKTDFINFVSGSPLVRETSIMRSKVITVTLGLDDISPENIVKINSWLIGTGKLIFSHDPGRYYIATCNNALTGEKILSLGKIPVQFNVMPYKYDNKETDTFEEIIVIDVLGLYKESTINYKGNAPAESVLKITGTGTIRITNKTSDDNPSPYVEITNVSDYCIIDIGAKKVYDSSNNVILDHTYGNIFDMMLTPGLNTFWFSTNVTKFEIKRKTRWY